MAIEPGELDTPRFPDDKNDTLVETATASASQLTAKDVNDYHVESAEGHRFTASFIPIVYDEQHECWSIPIFAQTSAQCDLKYSMGASRAITSGTVTARSVASAMIAVQDEELFGTFNSGTNADAMSSACYTQYETNGYTNISAFVMMPRNFDEVVMKEKFTLVSSVVSPLYQIMQTLYELQEELAKGENADIDVLKELRQKLAKQQKEGFLDKKKKTTGFPEHDSAFLFDKLQILDRYISLQERRQKEPEAIDPELDGKLAARKVTSMTQLFAEAVPLCARTYAKRIESARHRIALQEMSYDSPSMAMRHKDANLGCIKNLKRGLKRQIQSSDLAASDKVKLMKLVGECLQTILSIVQTDAITNQHHLSGRSMNVLAAAICNIQRLFESFECDLEIDVVHHLSQMFTAEHKHAFVEYCEKQMKRYEACDASLRDVLSSLHSLRDCKTPPATLEDALEVSELDRFTQMGDISASNRRMPRVELLSLAELDTLLFEQNQSADEQRLQEFLKPAQIEQLREALQDTTFRERCGLPAFEEHALQRQNQALSEETDSVKAHGSKSRVRGFIDGVAALAEERGVSAVDAVVKRVFKG